MRTQGGGSDRGGVGGWALLLLCLLLQLHPNMADLVGGVTAVPPGAENSLELDELAKFAVKEYNKRHNGVGELSFTRLVSAKQQVVQGLMYYLTVEVEKEEEKQVWEAKVWRKPWESSTVLEEFRFLHKAAEDGEKGGGRKEDVCSAHGNHGFRQVPSDDPVVVEAADEAVKGLQARSNSLFPYLLRHVVSAHAAICDDTTHFELVLSVISSREQNVKAELSRTADGRWSVKHFTLQ